MSRAWIAVLRAADAAARWHVNQRRKGARQEPYINHLLEVAALVAEATGGADPELIAAALLHDSIEDQEVPRAVLANKFGEGVARLVEEVTDDKVAAEAGAQAAAGRACGRRLAPRQDSQARRQDQQSARDRGERAA